MFNNSFDNQGAPRRDMDIIGRVGKIRKISQDPSEMLEITHSLLTSGQVYVLGGNQPLMWGLIHNTEPDGKGDWMGRQEADGCGGILFYEDQILRFVGAATAAKGVVPVMTQQFAIDLLTPYTSVARSGCAGEFLTATAAPAAVALTTATQATVTSVTLTAGDWDVDGVVNYTPGATTSITIIGQGANTVAATLGAQDTYLQDANAANVPGANIITKTIQTLRITVASGATQLVYLVARATFSVSTLTAGGTINARRWR